MIEKNNIKKFLRYPVFQIFFWMTNENVWDFPHLHSIIFCYQTLFRWYNCGWITKRHGKYHNHIHFCVMDFTFYKPNRVNKEPRQLSKELKRQQLPWKKLQTLSLNLQLHSSPSWKKSCCSGVPGLQELCWNVIVQRNQKVVTTVEFECKYVKV